MSPIRASTPIPAPEHVSVHVRLERRQLEDLELIVRRRHGEHHSRSAVIRRAVSWYLAKEADWLIRQHHADELRRERAEQLRAAREQPREARERQAVEAKIVEAVRLARESD